ncbi:hypothetical protein HZH66_014279 [Vespula vulgaris]|uniref:Uncharacterized protein n=1 Tax=Vespula vulgaris TaxID=7454 RepID=A0A834J3A5_VESVU|nr:hypothetical protein HZH66_014279 [Vespula vulgaris]
MGKREWTSYMARTRDETKKANDMFAAITIESTYSKTFKFSERASNTAVLVMSLWKTMSSSWKTVRSSVEARDVYERHDKVKFCQ